MNVVLLACLSLLFVACNVDRSVKKQLTQKAIIAPEQNLKTTLVARISVPAEIKNRRIEILETAEDTVSDGDHECSVSVVAGQIIKMRKSREFLILEKGDEEITLIRKEETSVWKSVIVDVENDVKLLTTIKLEEDKFTSTVECLFQK